VFDGEGHARDQKVAEQLRSLGREVTRAARQFKALVLTTPDAEQAEAQVQPISEEEVASA
ncbi:MAG: hypothetical protein M3371_07255, partial [Acidobacteriota bacterium]|nr:hypothetical protein [Acidobacteriota bacterium]